MAKEYISGKKKEFCSAYLKTMDPWKAAAVAGVEDGFALLGDRQVQQRLESMRSAAAAQILREDVIRRLCELAFGRSSDAVRLAMDGAEALDPGELDLSAVAEFRRTDKGGVEIRFLDRIRALQALGELLGGGEGDSADFFRALEAAGDLGEEESGRKAFNASLSSSGAY